MEWCVEDAREKWKRTYVLRGTVSWLICIAVGFVCLFFGYVGNSEGLGLILFIVWCGIGVLFSIGFFCARATVPKFAAERSMIRQYGEIGRGIGGVTVGETLAYISTYKVSRFFDTFIEKPFIIYENVKKVKRNTDMTIFVMRSGEYLGYFNSKISREAYEAMREKITARNGEVVFEDNDSSVPDIVYVDNGDGDWI